MLEAEAQAVRSLIDYTMLNECIGGTTIEHLTEWLLQRFAFLPATRVVVRRRLNSSWYIARTRP